MNKKGFTLVELSVSVTLLSLVMVFMLRFLNEIRKDEDAIGFKTEMSLHKTIISKNINEDIKKSGGISSLECANKKCVITLNDESIRELELKKDNSIVSYKDVTNDVLLFTRQLPEGQTFNLGLLNNEKVYVITILVELHPEYNIDIVNEKS